ncbi:hypothetical protein MTR67_044015 [Solanum verrucosum]|uniref:CCHC-type domain-containing protein n=1 Tax=Solanum verrucosum TaxID=315347 RepID=A0AAF0ZV88_SOLVR|nr:hypothetical protein MTR67_044015 [Solanum verrucosum]
MIKIIAPAPKIRSDFRSKKSQNSRARPTQFQGTVAQRTNWIPTCAKCGKNHPGECCDGSNGCFKCGQIGNVMRECPKNKKVMALHIHPTVNKDFINPTQISTMKGADQFGDQVLSSDSSSSYDYEVLRRARMYQEYMKVVHMPTQRGFVIPFTSWVGFATSMKEFYGQPLHYLTNVQMKKFDKMRLGADNEDVPLDTIILGDFSSIIKGGRRSILTWSLLEILFRVDTPPYALASRAVDFVGSGQIGWAIGIPEIFYVVETLPRFYPIKLALPFLLGWPMIPNEFLVFVMQVLVPATNDAMTLLAFEDAVALLACAYMIALLAFEDAMTLFAFAYRMTLSVFEDAMALLAFEDVMTRLAFEDVWPSQCLKMMVFSAFVDAMNLLAFEDALALLPFEYMMAPLAFEDAMTFLDFAYRMALLVFEYAMTLLAFAYMMALMEAMVLTHLIIRHE